MLFRFVLRRRLTKKWNRSFSDAIQGDHGEGVTDLASSKSSLDLGDGSTKDILAALRNNVGALFAAVKLDKLAGRVDDERCEVVPHLGLLLGLDTLALSGEASVHTLELREVLQRRGTLFRRCISY